MSTSQSTIDYLLDQLSNLPTVRVRKMFGEYALYCEFVSVDQLLLETVLS